MPVDPTFFLCFFLFTSFTLFLSFLFFPPPFGCQRSKNASSGVRDQQRTAAKNAKSASFLHTHALTSAEFVCYSKIRFSFSYQQNYRLCNEFLCTTSSSRFVLCNRLLSLPVSSLSCLPKPNSLLSFLSL